jgi:hypothetical protein
MWLCFEHGFVLNTTGVFSTWLEEASFQLFAPLQESLRLFLRPPTPRVLTARAPNERIEGSLIIVLEAPLFHQLKLWIGHRALLSR